MVSVPSHDLKRHPSQPVSAGQKNLVSPAVGADNVLPFKDIAKESYVALAESRLKRQQQQRLRYKVWEVFLVTTGAGVVATVVAVALVRFLPYQITQEQKLREISAEVSQLELQVNNLRDRLPERFGTGEPDSAFLRRHGWLRPGQFVVKFLAKDTPIAP